MTCIAYFPNSSLNELFSDVGCKFKIEAINFSKKELIHAFPPGLQRDSQHRKNMIFFIHNFSSVAHLLVNKCPG